MTSKTQSATDRNQVMRAAVSRASRPMALHPPYDVKETPQEYVAFIDLPGIDEDEIVLQFNGNLLQVSGFREFDHDAEDAEEYVQLGRPYGDFLCSIVFGSSIDSDGATAKYKRGVLKVRVPKVSVIEVKGGLQ